MDIPTLKMFFMWCTILNGGLLFFWTVMCMMAPNLVYRTQRYWFPLPQEQFTIVIYSFIAVYKIFFLMFNLVPYLALVIMG